MSQFRKAAVLLAMFAAACGDSPTPPSTPAALEASGTLPGVASIGSTLSPAVRVADARGRGVSGVAVTFQVTAGGGSVSQNTVNTNMSGVATLPGWFLGGTPGVNTLVASHGGLAPVTFTVTAADTDLLKVAGDQTTCPAGPTNSCRFAVRLRGPTGNGVPNQTIVWTGPGGATTSTTTNTLGYATAPNLGANTATGTFTQTARVESSGVEVSFSYTIVQGGQYNIDIRFIGTISPSQQALFAAARQRWEQVITGNLPAVNNINYAAGQACRDGSGTSLINHPAINESVDDLLVFVKVDSIDGPNGVLGRAGPCLVRTNGRLPVVGMMHFDVADFNRIENDGFLGDVILHELGHVLGFPNTWTDAPFALLQDTAAGGNPRFIGARAGPGFLLAGGTLINGNGVPVENTGSTGTRLAHWRESVLSNELMTGFINASGNTMPRNPLSAITIGSLMDIGYQVNFGAADAYVLPGASPNASLLTEGVRLEMIELPMPVPRAVH